MNPDTNSSTFEARVDAAFASRWTDCGLSVVEIQFQTPDGQVTRQALRERMLRERRQRAEHRAIRRATHSIGSSRS